MISALAVAVLSAAPLLAGATVQSPWRFNEATAKWENTDHWAVGANFINSNAQNELTMFQTSTYDRETIDRELGYAQDLGFNAVRVFLHNLLWEDRDALFATVDDFLALTSSRDIGVMLVLLDSCWNDSPALGPQPDPVPYRHNSVWVQAPGAAIVNGDAQQFESLIKPYVTGVVGHYQNDSRIIAWDLWNEPDNSGYTSDLISPLISSVFAWAREAAPTQPLTTPVWHGDYAVRPHLSQLEQIQLQESDVVSFHSYARLPVLEQDVKALATYGKPVVCTEYMAREAGSTFDPHMGYLQSESVAAFSWGLVAGKTQTIYPWDSNNDPNPYEGVDDPSPWFHDILLSDGSPKYPEEAEYIRGITGAKG